MKVHVLIILAVIATTKVVTVKCNYTLASTVTEGMVKDPQTTIESWMRVGNEGIEWGKEKIQEGLGLNHHHGSNHFTSGNEQEGNKEEETNISKGTKSEKCHTTNDGWGNLKKKCGVSETKTYETTKLKNNNNDDKQTYNSAEDFANKVSSYKNKISEKAEGLKEQAIEKARNVKEKVQEIVGKPSEVVEDKTNKEG